MARRAGRGGRAPCGRAAAGCFLFDTGIGAGYPELDARYHPVERHLADALACLGHGIEEVMRPRIATSTPTTPGRTIACRASRSTSSRRSGRPPLDPATRCPNGSMGRVCATSRSTATARCSPASRSSPARGTRPATSRCSSRPAADRVLLAGQAVYSRDEWEGRPGREGRTTARDDRYDETVRRLRGLDAVAVHFAHDQRWLPARAACKPSSVSRQTVMHGSSISTAGHPTAHAADPEGWAAHSSPRRNPGLRPPMALLGVFAALSPKGDIATCGTGPRLAANWGVTRCPALWELGLSSRSAGSPASAPHRPAASLACGL